MRTEAPDSAELADAASSLVGAYVHIPFCRRVCPYCDFAVVAGTEGADRYVAAVCAEISRSTPFDRPLDTVALGGGTPTSLSVAGLERILEALSRRLGLASGAEVSIEANPEDLGSDVVKGLAAAGFNRISLGVQSFDDAVLESLGRVHTSEEAAKALSLAVDTFATVNVDLIFGTPGETPESWEASVRAALDAGIGHLSTYALTVERGTPLSRAVAAGAPGPDPDVQADLFDRATSLAASAGLFRYETSNHARPGETVAYNLLTWAQGEYEGFGNGVHRHRDGVRSWNVRRVDRYMERVDRGEVASSDSERLGSWEREVERVMLGLRRTAGVAAGTAGELLVESEAGSRLVAAGILEEAGGRVRVLRPMLGDEVARALLALDPADC